MAEHFVPPFPKIVALLGAQTALGQALLRLLLDSELVERVHAIATSDHAPLRAGPPAAALPARQRHKLVASLSPPARLGAALERVREVDIALCVETTERHAFDALGRDAFVAFNVEAPARFVQRMFALGALTVSVLSYAKADVASRSEFCKAKGMLEQIVSETRRDAAEFSPLISIFRLPALEGAAGAVAPRASSRERRAAAEAAAAAAAAGEPPLHIEQVAQAMFIDAFAKAEQRRVTSSRNRREYFEARDIPLILQGV